jgi:hypothetical protein
MSEKDWIVERKGKNGNKIFKIKTIRLIKSVQSMFAYFPRIVKITDEM